MTNYKELAQALYFLNKKAKEYRDVDNNTYSDLSSRSDFERAIKAREKKEKIYEIKDRVLRKLNKQKSLKIVGYTKTYTKTFGVSCWLYVKFNGNGFHCQPFDNIKLTKIKKMKNLNSSIGSKVESTKAGSIQTEQQALEIVNTFLKTDYNF